MIERSERLKVFNTDESSGRDLCVKESNGRFVLIHESELEFILEAISKAAIQDHRTESVKEPFGYI